MGCSDRAGHDEADARAPSNERDGGDDVALLDAGAFDGGPAFDADLFAPDAAPAVYTLSVTTTIGGSVSVLVDDLAVASCPADQTCNVPLEEGTQTFLLPTNETRVFCIWSGDCVGQGLCGLTMDDDKSVIAEFRVADQDCP